LSLGDNKFSQSGASALADALDHNSTLTRLDRCMFGDVVGACMSQFNAKEFVVAIGDATGENTDFNRNPRNESAKNILCSAWTGHG
jgi:Ran GTPase-activating protein (RanGAP) involved in mRNA processing and transport